MRWAERMKLPMALVGDPEGARVPSSLPPIVDAHVHLFPERVFDALWRWFETYAWPIRYKLYSLAVVDFLLERGVDRVLALHYAHKPGMARALNAHVAEVCRQRPKVLGLATVLPGEEGAGRILEEAFALGLRGVKLHCHVQAFSPDSPAMHEVYSACIKADAPLIIHAGREPAIPAYKVDPYSLCSADRIERVLLDWPKLKLCVPHMGADELSSYERLLERYDNLWLDTTMAAAGLFPTEFPARLLFARPERILYGTDFPNLPYAWDRELARLCALGLPEEALAKVLGGTARALFPELEDPPNVARRG